MEELFERDIKLEDLNEEQEVTLCEEDTYFSGDIKVVSSDNPYVLGKLVGTFMVAEEDNGNGRWYERETLDLGVAQLPYTKRMIQHKSLLGEAHHPLERTNIWMDEAAISTTKLEMRGNVLYGEADILDTPKGRIVNTLARYGTDIGISSRAQGKGVKRNGHLAITRDKYFFKTFDAVLNPGFEQARPDKFEPDGAHMKVYEESSNEISLYEELKSQIENNKCDKKMLDYYINYTGDENLKDLTKLFEDATTDSILDNIEENNMELEGLKSKVVELSEENSKLKTQVSNLNSDLNQINEEREFTSERLDYVTKESNRSQSLAESQVEDLLGILNQKNDEIDTLSEEITSLKNQLSELRFKYAGLSSRTLSVNEERKDQVSVVEELKHQISELENDLFEEMESNKSYRSQIEELKDNLSKSEAVNEEFKSINEELNNEIYELNKESDEVPHKESIIPKSVDLFNSSVEAINEEQTEDNSDRKKEIFRQSSLIRKVGGR